MPSRLDLRPGIYNNLLPRPCHHRIAQRRSLASLAQHPTATSDISSDIPPTTLNTARIDPTKDAKPARLRKDQSYKTSVGILLCRSPIITRELSEFEKAFYAYQRHLKSRLASPFPLDFYFTKGSLAAKRWQAGEHSRSNDTHLKEEITGEERELQEEEDIASQVAMSRTTQADKDHDTKSLNRALDRTLYLLLRKDRDEYAWQFPQGAMGLNETLTDSSSRVLTSLAGRNMKTWQVGKIPVGHLQYPYQDRHGHPGNKVFFMKSRIFAGQCQLSRDAGVVEYGWFTSDEVNEKVDERYWKQVKAMLASQ